MIMSKGKEAAGEPFAGELDAHRNRVFAYVYTRVGRDQALAEDLTQDALVQVWKTRESNPPPAGALPAYLFTTARNLLRDRFRRREVEASLLGAGTPPTPEERYLLRETVERISAEIALLPPILRETMRLRAEDWDYTAIAARMCCPVGTVRSRLSAARQRLRAALEQAERIDEPTGIISTQRSRTDGNTTVTKEQTTMSTSSEIKDLRAQVAAMEARLGTLESGGAKREPDADTDPWQSAWRHFARDLRRRREEKEGAFAFGFVHIVTQSVKGGMDGSKSGKETFDSAAQLPSDERLTKRLERMRRLTADPLLPRVFRHFYTLPFAGREMRASASELAEALGETRERIAAVLKPLLADRTLLLVNDGAGGETYEWEGNDAAIAVLLFAA